MIIQSWVCNSNELQLTRILTDSKECFSQTVALSRCIGGRDTSSTGRTSTCCSSTSATRWTTSDHLSLRSTSNFISLIIITTTHTLGCEYRESDIQPSTLTGRHDTCSEGTTKSGLSCCTGCEFFTTNAILLTRWLLTRRSVSRSRVFIFFG